MTSRAEKIDRFPNKININVSKIQNLVRILRINFVNNGRFVFLSLSYGRKVQDRNH